MGDAISWGPLILGTIAAVDNLEEAIKLEEEMAELRPVTKIYFAYPATERAEDDQPSVEATAL